MIVKALTSDPDAAPSRLVVHLAKRAGRTELRAVAQAATLAGVNVPSALLRLDDTSLWDLADCRTGHLLARQGHRGAAWTDPRCCSPRG